MTKPDLIKKFNSLAEVLAFYKKKKEAGEIPPHLYFHLMVDEGEVTKDSFGELQKKLVPLLDLKELLVIFYWSKEYGIYHCSVTLGPFLNEIVLGVVFISAPTFWDYVWGAITHPILFFKSLRR